MAFYFLKRVIKISTFFILQVDNRADGSFDDKQLPPPIDIRHPKRVKSALSAFKGKAKTERKNNGINRVIGPPALTHQNEIQQ